AGRGQARAIGAEGQRVRFHRVSGEVEQRTPGPVIPEGHSTGAGVRPPGHGEPFSPGTEGQRGDGSGAGRVCTCLEETSQTLTSPSSPPEPKRGPSSLNATASGPSGRPGIGGRGGCVLRKVVCCRPLAVSQTTTVPSEPAHPSRRPSGLK